MPLGLPHSKFLRWSEDDQDKALAWQEAKRTICSQCGTEDEEWVRIDEEGKVQPILPQPYVHDFRRCHGCEIIAKAQEDIPVSARGVYVRLMVNPELNEGVET